MLLPPFFIMNHLKDNKPKQNFLSKIRSCVHPNCVVCSPSNSEGLHFEYRLTENGNIQTDFFCYPEYEGYPGIMHGGIITSILDGAMGNCIFARGKTAVTIEMNTRFRSPVLINKMATVKAEIIDCSRPILLLEARLVQDEKVKASAKAKFFNQPHLAESLDK